MSGSSTKFSRHLRANVIGYAAVFIALAGTASALPGKNKVDSGDIKAGQVKASDLAANAVSSPKVLDNSLLGADIDESTLELPAFPELPETLPPSGPAGGDLGGTYPDPNVSEAALNAGGDLTGTLDAAQLGPNSVGSPEIANDAVGSSEIADESVGDADIGDTTQSVELGAWMVDDSRLGVAGAPSAGTTAVGGYPVLQFDAATDESVSFVTRLPDLQTPGGLASVTFLWTAPNTGTVRWDTRMTSVTPASAETLAASSQFSVSGNDQSDAPNEIERVGPNGVGSGAFQPGDLVRIDVTRDANSASDTLAGDASLLLLTIDVQTKR